MSPVATVDKQTKEAGLVSSVATVAEQTKEAGRSLWWTKGKPDDAGMRSATGVTAATGHSAQRPSKPGWTLEKKILSVWEDLVVDGRAECPVCSGKLGIAGCDDCGSQLT